MGLKLNLGCGSKLLPGYVNVDKFGEPEVLFDLETRPWPWADNSVDEILLIHVLEHLGATTDVYLGIIQELYRVCEADASIRIKVPHPRHSYFLDDPTHVRAITPMGLALFSKRLNRFWAEKGYSNTPLGLNLDVDFEIVSTHFVPSQQYYARHPEKEIDFNLLVQESEMFLNVIEEMQVVLRAVK